jgi:hypothetical protein
MKIEGGSRGSRVERGGECNRWCRTSRTEDRGRA